LSFSPDSATQDADDTQTEMTKLQHRKDSIHHQVVEHVRNQEEMSKELEKMTNEIQQFQKSRSEGKLELASCNYINIKENHLYTISVYKTNIFI
jgi:uncharacterized membrane-anchored protein YhcB (DUF1043 family)